MPRIPQLLLHTGTLSSIYHKSPQTFIRTAKARYLTGKTAPLPARAQAVIESFYLRHDRLSRFERFITETPSTTWDSLAIGSPAPIINIATRPTCHCTSTADSVDRHQRRGRLLADRWELQRALCSACRRTWRRWRLSSGPPATERLQQVDGRRFAWLSRVPDELF